MTDTSSSAATYPSQQPAPFIVSSVASPIFNGSPADAVAQDDNEDYTIKCICTYGDDDGSTVYCEKCDTWQHIICYYQGKKVPEIHFCADCDPRQLDAKRATENQKRLREHVDGSGDRKAKRPPTRSHKKKKDSGATVEQTNGVHSHGRHESISAVRDQPPPAKRAKTSHRASASIASINGVPALPEPRKRASSNINAYPSPVKSPSSQPLHPPIPIYAPEFLNLYENDQGKYDIDCAENISNYPNSMSMAVTNALTAWYDNPLALKQVTSKQHEEVFCKSEQLPKPSSWPRVHLREKTNTEINYNGQCPKWKFVVLETSVGKDDFIGEIKGDIGHLEEYCRDPGTRWNELHHPEPFVFFHPHIPIYIDSRAEGTQFRYLRRSCHANVSLKTFVTGERDFHHCFVAKENIPAGTELTAMWYIDQNLFGNGKVKEENGDEDEKRRRAAYFSKILSNFGDCACDATDCWLKTFDLRTPPENPKKRSDFRRGRGKVKHAASPSSTGHTTTSRAGSENMPLSEEEDQGDSRSTSSSAQSKPPSRDITPAHFLPGGSYGPSHEASHGLSARERRKILMAERAFQDQETKKQKAKRKRMSGGVTTNTANTTNPAVFGFTDAQTSTSSLLGTPSLPAKSLHLNTTSTNIAVSSQSLHPQPFSAPLRRTTNMSPRKTSTPTTPSPLSQSLHKVYVDKGIQTDPEPEELEPPELKWPTVIPGYENWEPPHMKRIKIYNEWERKDNIKREELRKKIEAGLCSPFATIVPTFLEERRAEDKRRMERRAKRARESDEVVSAAAPVSPSSDISHISHSTTATEESKSGTPAMPTPTPPPPLPSQAAHTQNKPRPPNNPKLQLSTLPPVPPFNNPFNNGNPSASSVSATFSPTPTTPAAAQSPFGYVGSAHAYPALAAGAVAPSPVKKKLSLGDYMSRRSNLTTPIAEKTQSQVTGMALAAPAAVPVSPAPNGQQKGSRQVTGLDQPTAVIKPDEYVKAEAKVSAVSGVPAVVDPQRAMGDVTLTAPMVTILPSTQSSIPPASNSPELSSVLSKLHALAAGNVARREPGGS